MVEISQNWIGTSWKMNRTLAEALAFATSLAEVDAASDPDAAKSGATLPEIASAANNGAEATRTMVATIGRAARLGDRSLGHADPGAVSAAMIVEELTRAFA